MNLKHIFLSLLIFASNAFAFNLTANSWIVADGDGYVIQSENENAVRSIASITKLMTAMVTIDDDVSLDAKIGNYTRLQLLQLAMIKSDNNAAKLLCQHHSEGRVGCIRRMNEKAYYLNMTNTKFVEPTGLSPMNISTATDLVKLLQEAKYYKEIVDASGTQNATIRIKKKLVAFHNTNPIIGKRHSFIVSKTGTTRAAGGCIAMIVDTEKGRRIVVLLGSKNGKTRIPEAEYIATRI